MKVFKVIFENNTVTSVITATNVEHGETGLTVDKENILWLAIECSDEKIAVEVAEQVVKMIWPKEAA